MSKIVSYICDNLCGEKSTDIVESKWIEIGSDNKSLSIFNHTKEALVISIQRYDKIHFCSKKCLIKYLFNNK